MKQRNTGLHVGKYRKNRTFSSRLTETILPSALIFCALAGLLITVTGLSSILPLFASGLIFGLMTTGDVEYAVNCGAAHGALAMTTPGDTSMATFEEVKKLMKGGGARVDR